MFTFKQVKIIKRYVKFEEEKEKSSHYGLYKMGFTCATRVKTMSLDSVNLNKPLKITVVRIGDCNSSP